MKKVDDKICEEISKKLCQVGNFEFDLLGNNCICEKGIKNSINNQGGYLSEENFFGRNLEYTLKINSDEYPIAFQLYKNVKDFYRIFLLTKNNKMLTSVNLTKGQNAERITFDIQIKISSPQSATQEERKFMRDECVKKLVEYGLNVDKKNHIYLGEYDISERKFFNTTPKNLIQNLLIIGICKNKAIFGI
ncbi:MAG: hypothetical protein IKZ58_03830 [Selenomonadaceae bacterium]|nr:hypothetical protein [Selenomonadaceae bacterium]